MLTISDYKNWALNDQRSAVVLDDVGNALMTEKDRLGRVTRTFNRGAVKYSCGVCPHYPSGSVPIAHKDD